MNKLISFFTLFVLIGLATSCNHLHDDDYHPNIPLPPQVQDFISGNYAGLNIQHTYLEDICDNLPAYEVELEDGPGPDKDLYFDLNWNFLFEATEISNSALPGAVQAAIQAEFPGYGIDPGNSERYDFPDGTVQYKVELKSASSPDLEVVFWPDGSIYCKDSSSDSDDDDDHSGNHGGHHESTVNMPASVQTFISGNYPGYQIDEVYKEDICDDVPVYEVELEDGPGPDIDLYFDLNWTFLFRASRISAANLPAPVLSTIQAQFPGYVIIPGSAERYDFPDGSVQYKVELEQNDDDDWEVVLTAGGNTVCAELD